MTRRSIGPCSRATRDWKACSSPDLSELSSGSWSLSVTPTPGLLRAGTPLSVQEEAPALQRPDSAHAANPAHEQGAQDKPDRRAREHDAEPKEIAGREAEDVLARVIERVQDRRE